MIEDWIRFENVEIDRGGYFATYSPLFTGENLATLVITFYEPIKPSSAVEIIESEFSYWIARFPTPLVVFVSNETGAKLDIASITGCEHLIGYFDKLGNTVMKWEAIPDTEYSHMQFDKKDTLRIYSGLNYKTINDAKNEIAKKIKANKVIISIMVLWCCIIPALIAIFGWSNPYISFLALIYSLFVVVRKVMEITGKIKPTEKRIRENEEQRQKDHHHYHCKLNPEGFLILKNENFSKENNAQLEQKTKKANNPINPTE